MHATRSTQEQGCLTDAWRGERAAPLAVDSVGRLADISVPSNLLHILGECDAVLARGCRRSAHLLPIACDVTGCLSNVSNPQPATCNISTIDAHTRPTYYLIPHYLGTTAALPSMPCLLLQIRRNRPPARRLPSVPPRTSPTQSRTPCQASCAA
jgi:hypothetical protein